MEKPEYHPIANLFPLIEGEEFENLKKDIQANGLLTPIEVYEGKILDGRNRYRACLQIGVQPKFINYDGDAPISRVVSLNLRRRHLTESQRADIASQLCGMKRGRPLKNPPIGGFSSTQAEAAKLMNVSLRSVQRASTVLEKGIPELKKKVEDGGLKVGPASDVAGEPPAVQEEIVARGEKEIIKAAREIRKRRVEERKSDASKAADELARDDSAPFVTDLTKLKGQKFGCIYMDPPWSYDNQSTRAATGNHYESMSVEQLSLLPIDDLAAEKCHLHLWVTNAYLLEGMKLMQDWGFHFKSTFVWVKPQIGMGNYWRNSHEIMLLGIRGGQRAIARDQRSWLECSRGEHSAKPEQVRRAIEQLSPGPYLELFGRGTRKGWTVFGNQTLGELDIL